MFIPSLKQVPRSYDLSRQIQKSTLIEFLLINQHFIVFIVLETR